MIDYHRISDMLNDGRLGLRPEQVALAHQEARQQGVGLKRALLQQAAVDEYKLLEALATATDTPFSVLEEGEISEEAVRKVPASIVAHYHVMPVSLIDGGVRVATDDPFNENLCEELVLLLNQRVDLMLATSESITKAIRRHYGVGADTVEQMVSREGTLEVEEGSSARLDDDGAARDASVIKLLNEVLKDAIEQRATDVHFEPFEQELRVRYRVDGVLREAGVPPAAKQFRHAIVSRAKILGNLDVAERRLPQDGRAQANLDGKVYDLRISILPTPHGEALNFRILPRDRVIDDLESLGLEGQELDGLRRLILKPHGIILVTGPTGSGKTTTLYTVLKLLNKPDTKIITIEDPIEYRMPGLVQMQVHPEIGFTFGVALRSVLRHDPDVILIGETRDYETAEITIRTSLTGHLVFTTLHTNDAPTAIGRLTDIGVEPFLIASSVEGVLAQRLVRLICPHCREWYEPEGAVLNQLGQDANGVGRLARGRGCRECRFTGYLGRTCIAELMLMNLELREMVTAKRNASDIRSAALRHGMHTLRMSGLHKMTRGVTTIEEVLRVTPSLETDDTVIVGEG